MTLNLIQVLVWIWTTKSVFDDFDMDDDTESEVSAETAETVETEENADETVTVEE